MLSVSYAGKNAYSAGKTSGVLRGVASGANRCYVLTRARPIIGIIGIGIGISVFLAKSVSVSV